MTDTELTVEIIETQMNTMPIAYSYRLHVTAEETLIFVYKDALKRTSKAFNEKVFFVHSCLYAKNMYINANNQTLCCRCKQLNIMTSKVTAFYSDK